MMNKKSLDTKIDDLWKRYVAGDVVEYARDNSNGFPHSFMEMFANRFLASSILANLHHLDGEEARDHAQRLMYRICKIFTHEDPVAHMSFFKTMVKVEASVRADEEAAAATRARTAAKDAQAAKIKAMEVRARCYLKNTGVSPRDSKVPSKHWFP